jgi:hypothetical protein
MATVSKAFRVLNGLTVLGAELRPAAGTTSYPPILLTSGTNLTTATAGAFEYDGTNFYLTPASTRKTIAFLDSNITGTSAGISGSQTANYVYAAPNGSAGTATFRALVAADIPTLNQNTTGSAGSVANSVTFNNGGTGDASGTTFNGSAARTISYNTVGAAASSHAHGNITSAGAIGSTSGLVVVTTASGVLTTLAAGSSGQFLKHDATFGNVYLGTTTLQGSSVNQAVTGVTSITAGTGTSNLTLQTAATVGAPSGAIEIKTGNVTTSGNSGNITIDAGSAAGSAGTIYIGGTNAGAVEVGRSGQTTVIKGNLQIDGTTTTVNSTTITIDDKNLVLGNDQTLDTQADGGGITLNGATPKTLNWVDATDAWTSSEHFNLLTGKAYYINGTSVLSNNTLGSGVTSSSLTKVGALSGGTAGFVKVDASGNLTSDSTTYAPLASPTFTGTPAAPTAAADTNTTQIATTAYVVGQGYLKSATASSTYAPLASPALTGTPTINSVAGLVTASGSTTGTTALTLSSVYSSSTYNGGEFIIKATNSTNIEITKVLVITDGSNVYITTYGDVFVSANLVDIDFTYTSTNVNMVVTPVAGTTGTTSVKVTGTLVAV